MRDVRQIRSPAIARPINVSPFLVQESTTRSHLKLRRTCAHVWQRRIGIAGWFGVLAFAVLVARFWHPYYGMTRLVQFDAATAERAIHEMHESPIFVYRDHGGYDGLFYAQIAFHPLLDSKELDHALDNPGFRSRRILMSATAWLLAGGREPWIAEVFAWLNIAAWLALAALLWRLLDVRDWRGWLAWAGLVFSAGVLHSVRQSLTDLPALLLVAGGMFLVERGRICGATGAIAAAALTRETSILSIVGVWGTDWRRPATWIRNGLIGLAVAVPLALWLVYVRQRFGPGDAGTSNFTWPLVDWLGKWPQIAQDYQHPAFRWLVTTTLLATIGMTTQFVFFVVYRRFADGWWRIGAIHALMLIFLGRAIWEGHPGSFTRVLLPMSLAFAVCASRWRVSPLWLVIGGLSVFAGVEPWRSVVVHRDDLSSGRVAGCGYLVELGEGFFQRELRRSYVRSWSSGSGTVSLKFTASPEASQFRASLQVRGFGDRTVSIADPQGEVWNGSVGTDWQPADFLIRPDNSGKWWLRVTSPEPAIREADVPGARDLAFAIRDVELNAVP